MAYTPRLKEKYMKEIVPALMKQFNYKSVMQVPKMTKICRQPGIGSAITDQKHIDNGIKK